MTEKTAEETASHEDRTIDVTDRGIYPPPPWSSRVENVTGGEYYTEMMVFGIIEMKMAMYNWWSYYRWC